MTTLQENSIFAGRYRIVRCIAAGGMGAVYEAMHLETERRRALKVMLPHFVQSPELRERFKLEARVAAQIDSEFIVDVFDAGIEEATQMPFLVMELLKGEELGKRLERVGRFAVTEAITYLWQTALALDKTHKANIVHRDLKPENLFLTQREDGPPRVKVLDFGVAKFVAEMGTQGGATRSLGTPLYMAPEQFRGQVVSPASDNFALAMMAFTLMVGETYWAKEADGATDVIAFALTAAMGPTEPATARAARKGVTFPAAFDAWFARGTATDPALRFASATATVGALAQLFGLNAAKMTGVASSDPLPSLEVGRTLPLGSVGPTTGTVVATSIPGMQPLGSAATGTVGTTFGANLVTQVTTSVAPRKSSMSIAIGAVAMLAMGGVGIGLYAFNAHHVDARHSIDAFSGAAPTERSVDSAIIPSTASATRGVASQLTPEAPAAVPPVRSAATTPTPAEAGKVSPSPINPSKHSASGAKPVGAPLPTLPPASPPVSSGSGYTQD